MNWSSKLISKVSDCFLLFALFPRLFSFYTHYFWHFWGTYLWLKDPSLKVIAFFFFFYFLSLSA